MASNSAGPLSDAKIYRIYQGVDGKSMYRLAAAQATSGLAVEVNQSAWDVGSRMFDLVKLVSSVREVVGGESRHQGHEDHDLDVLFGA
jgi:hypothetical protein